MQPPAVRWDRKGLGVIRCSSGGYQECGGTNRGKEAARARQGARVGSRMMGRSQRAHSGHKTCGSGELTVLSDKALRQISKGRRSHRAKGVRVSVSREGF